MGVFGKGAQRADENLHEVLDALLLDGEAMLGRLLATHSKTFSASQRATRRLDPTLLLTG